MRRLRGDLPRLWADHRGSLGRQYRSHYQALADRLGPFDALACQYASATAALWVQWRAAEQTLTAAQRQRREGRGRRPSVSGIARLQKRGGLAWASYDSALKRLEELARSNGHGRPPLTLDESLAMERSCHA